MIDSSREPAALLYDVSRLIRRRFGVQIADLGMTEPQWRVLTFLDHSDGLSQTELASLLGIGKAPLGEQIDRLEAAGLVLRRPDPHDRRVRRLFVTPRGHRTAATIARRFAALRQVLKQAVRADAWHQFQKALTALAGGLLTGPVQGALERVHGEDTTYLIGIVCLQLRRQFDHALRELGFTRTEWLVMMTVAANAGATQSEIATTAGLGRTPVARLVDRLQQRGWIERHTNPDDRRANLLDLAGDAGTRVEDVLERYRVLHRGLLQPLDKRDREALLSGLERMRRALITHTEPATDISPVATVQAR